MPTIRAIRAAVRAARVGVLTTQPRFGMIVASAAARAAGAVHLLSTHPLPDAARPRFLAGWTHLAGDASLEAVLAASGLDAVLPSDLASTRLLAGLSGEGGAGPCRLPLSPPQVLSALHDKYVFKTLCEAAGVLVPETRLLAAPADARACLDRLLAGGDTLRFPVVTKPIAAQNGRGVRIHRSARDLAAALATGGVWLPGVVQRYVPGRDVDLSLLARDGHVLCAVLQERIAGGGLRFFRDAEAEAMGARLIAHLGFSGVVHLDLRREAASGRPVAIEANPRFWGSLGWADGAGLGFVGQAIALALGLPVTDWPLDLSLRVRTPIGWWRALGRGELPNPRELRAAVRLRPAPRSVMDGDPVR
ncbi:MAG: ATP-grasp domain-containing protein [Alphaproteobacteria bacterium]|nr:ATP-grasp domain-containing protein [Alphaproteobacteria bacterium]